MPPPPPALPAARVLIVRHGQSVWNAIGRWQGHADIPLSDLGRRQAATGSAQLPVVDAIWSSDLARTAETAEIMASSLDLPVRFDTHFRERAAGEWEGLTRDEIEAGWPGFLDRHLRPPGFEHDEQLLDRVLAGLAELHRAHPGQTVLLVSHGGVLRALERHAGAADGPFPNLSGRFFTVSSAGPDGPGRADQPAVELGQRLYLLAGDETTYSPVT
jgi:broad specificity phosphatase PhoE